MVKAERIKVLLGWWLTLTLLSTLINGVVQPLSPPPPPHPYTSNDCGFTCVACDTFYEVHYVVEDGGEPTPVQFGEYCCRPDWGCWLNPATDNYQVSWCIRTLMVCVKVTGEKVYCCSSGEECQELNGAPCCEPTGTYPCP